MSICQNCGHKQGNFGRMRFVSFGKYKKSSIINWCNTCILYWKQSRNQEIKLVNDFNEIINQSYFGVLTKKTALRILHYLDKKRDKIYYDNASR